MIKRYGNIFFAIIISSISLFSCKKDSDVNNSSTTQPDQLPPITTTGANTFGCRVDGEVWVPDVGVGNIPIQADYNNGVCNIRGIKELYNNDFTALIIYQTLGVNVFTGFSTSDTILLTYPHTWPSVLYDKARGFYDDNVPGNCEYETDSTYQGYLKIIHLDTINRIISGVFEFDAFSPNCNKIVHITEGRFDVEY